MKPVFRPAAYLAITRVFALEGETKTEMEQRLSRTGRALLKGLLRDCCHLDYAAMEVRKKEKGKPYFPDYPNIHFNISHSGFWTACVVSGYNVGIDIQIHRKTNIEMISKRLFPEEMQRKVENADDKEQAFFECWTMLESYAKWKGCGLSERLAMPKTGCFYPVTVDKGYSGMLYCAEPVFIEKKEIHL